MDTDDISKSAQEGWEKVKSGADKAKGCFRECADAVLDQGEEAFNGLKDFITERPFAAIGIASVVGLFIGLLRRR